MRTRVHMLPKTVISSTQILTRRSQSALGFEYCQWAAQNGHLHILEYLVERKFDEYTEDACENAAMNGQLDCLKYLHETAKAPWDSEAVRRAHESKPTPNVYNTSSTTTVLYQKAGLTKMESYTAWNQNQNQNKT